MKDGWATPDYIYKPLHSVFHFQLDAAADCYNAKHINYYAYKSEEDNGLVNPWSGLTTFCNPPYSEGQYRYWITKCITEYNPRKDTFVMLLPGSWETDAFAPVWEFAHYMIFPYRRIQFVHPNGKKTGGATFTSLIPVFTPRLLTEGEVSILNGIGRVVDLWKGLAPCS